MSDICVASHHSSIAELLADKEFLGLANREGFLIELRLDFYSDLSNENLDRALKVFAPRTVVTCRHPEEGGKNPKLSDAERVAFLQRAADFGVKYVDIEGRTSREGFRNGTATLIESYHDFSGGPSSSEEFGPPDLEEGAIGKIACMPVLDEDQMELKLMLELARIAELPSIILGMGEEGLWTRILAPLFNAPFTFARGEGTSGTAPGQPTWRELDELYRFRQIKPGWPIYGVIGNPIGHSLSPLLHNTALRELNLPGTYLPFKIVSQPIRLVEEFSDIGLRGVSVTIPHKEDGRWEDIAELDALAKNIGAVNTLTLREGKWFATNTDAIAAADAIETAAESLKGKRIAILGAGGAARAVAFGVRERGAEIFLINRTRERAEELAEHCGGSVITSAELCRTKIDAVVNATPLGMHPNVDASPLEKDQIPEGSIVFDTVYNPLRTKLLNLAAQRGCKTVEGWTMFIGQGVRQFELWTGAKAPRAAMEKAVLDELKRRQAQK